MRGPIDYIIVGFTNKKFDGSILKSLEEPLKKDIIKLVALTVIKKDDAGNVTYVDVNELGDEHQYIVEFMNKYDPDLKQADPKDVDEVGELLESNVTAGLLVVEQLWAKPLKKAIIDAEGVLLAEGRIHPDAVEDLEYYLS